MAKSSWLMYLTTAWQLVKLLLEDELDEKREQWVRKQCCEIVTHDDQSGTFAPSEIREVLSMLARWVKRKCRKKQGVPLPPYT